MDILEKVRKEGLVFDGAMGSILIGKGITGGEASELWNLKHPDIIMEIHRAYYDAGSDVASAKNAALAGIWRIRDKTKKNGCYPKCGRNKPNRGQDCKKGLR